MRPKDFEQSTHVLGKDQPEYIALPTHVNTEDSAVPMTCCFELTEEEAQKIATTREIWYRQLTFGNAFHPMHLQVDNPFVENIEKLVPTERPEFGKALTTLLNQYSKDVETNTPDWVLFEYIEDMLAAYGKANTNRAFASRQLV